MNRPHKYRDIRMLGSSPLARKETATPDVTFIEEVPIPLRDTGCG